MIKDEKDNTTLPASTNPPIHSQPVVSGDKGAQTLQGTSARNKIFVEYGLPQSLNQSLAASATFSLHCYADPLVRLLVSDTSTFKGSSLIEPPVSSLGDLRHLYGNGNTDEENFLSNFIIDEYLLLLQKASEADGLQTKALCWEQFERRSLSMLTQLLQKKWRLKSKMQSWYLAVP